MKHRLLSIPVLALLALAPLTQLHAQLSNTTLTVTSTTVTIRFNAPPGTTVDKFALQSSPNLTAAWTPVTATFTQLAAGQYSVAVSRPAGTKFFYRVLLNGQVITATISAGGVTIGEGSGSGVPVTFSAPFTGALPYVITFANGTSQNGSLTLNNATSAIIPLSVPDDDVITGDRFATVTVLPNTLGGGTGEVTISDNDEIWDGVVVTEKGGQLAFTMERHRFGGEYVLLSNANGSNFLPPGMGPSLALSANPGSIFNATTVDLQLSSAFLPAAASPFGVPSFYRLRLTGQVWKNAATQVVNPNAFNGETAGSAVVETIYDKIPALPDVKEPNDTAATASPVTAPFPAVVQEMTITGGNDDFFRYTSTGTTNPRFRIEFTHADGDLDIRLLDSGGAQLAISEGTVDSELIDSGTLTNGQSVTLRVYGFNGAANSYRLIVGNGSLPPVTNVKHLNTSMPAKFMLIKRPRKQADIKARLTPAP